MNNFLPCLMAARAWNRVPDVSLASTMIVAHSEIGHRDVSFRKEGAIVSVVSLHVPLQRDLTHEP